MLKNNNNVAMSLNTNPKEETKMNNTNYERISTETELLSQLMDNLNNKEEETMDKFHAEVKDFETGHIGRGYVVDEGNQYLVHPYMLEIDPDNGSVSCRHYAPYYLDKEWEGWEYSIFQEDLDEELVAIWEEENFVSSNNKEEETKMKMDLQFFGIKVEEEVEMEKQVKRFYDIAKQIEEIDEAGRDVYLNGVKISWEAIKQFMYGLSDEELELLAYSNKPEIPAELEAYAIYLLEAEKAWNNELTMQNAYFNGQRI